MPDDALIKSLLDPILQQELIEKETKVLRDLMMETCSEIIIEAAKLGPLHLELIALDAVRGISGIAAMDLARSGFVDRENLGEVGGRFRCAACRGFTLGALKGISRRGAKP